MSKILMLLQSEFPPDIRLEKEISVLIKSGFDLTLLCNSYHKKGFKDFNFGKIIRIKSLCSSVKLNKIFNFPLFINPRFIYYAVKTYLAEKPDFIHAHDLPMVPLALLLKYIFKKPVIFDMHENYPEALKFFEKKGLINFLFKNYKFAKHLEKFCIKHSDIIISVVEENKQRLKKLGIPENKLFVVSNTVDLDTFTFENTIHIDLSDYKDKFIVVYTGTVSPERGLFTAVKAVKKIVQQIPNFRMLIIGDGKSVIPLNDYIVKNNLADFVIMIPWVGHEKVLNYIKLADVCMIPQPANEFINTTIPHKLFEYMSIGKTILASDAIPLKRIIEETNCGKVFKSEDPEDFTKKIFELSSKHKEFEQNGKKAVSEKYNWKNDSKTLIKLYDDFKFSNKLI